MVQFLIPKWKQILRRRKETKSQCRERMTRIGPAWAISQVFFTHLRCIWWNTNLSKTRTCLKKIQKWWATVSFFRELNSSSYPSFCTVCVLAVLVTDPLKIVQVAFLLLENATGKNNLTPPIPNSWPCIGKNQSTAAEATASAWDNISSRVQRELSQTQSQRCSLKWQSMFLWAQLSGCRSTGQPCNISCVSKLSLQLLDSLCGLLEHYPWHASWSSESTWQ